MSAALERWAEAAPRPLVLLIDEIDTLVGDSLLSVLQQLRAGYPNRPARFPQSVVLCGLRDVRDYRMGAAGSPFNVLVNGESVIRDGVHTQARAGRVLRRGAE